MANWVWFSGGYTGSISRTMQPCETRMRRWESGTSGSTATTSG
uniref:Uncharacterized protein n=1 Tax=Arundo donax TaxID=35708 RepID=A0A0A9F2N9_ARUDO